MKKIHFIHYHIMKQTEALKINQWTDFHLFKS